MTHWRHWTAGVDVSHWQGDIDWDRLARYEVEPDKRVRFAALKASEGPRKRGASPYTDPTYRQHLEAARRVGLVVGAYHLLRPDVPGDADLEARHFLSVAQPLAGDLIPALDCETKWLDASEPRHAVAEILVWADVVHRALHVWPLLYVSARGIRHLVERSEPHVVEPLARLPLWLAGSPEVPAPWESWRLWQWSSTAADEQRAGVESHGLDLDWFDGPAGALPRIGRLPVLDDGDPRRIT